MVWPPTLADLRDDLDLEQVDTRDDDALSERLAAAVAFVEDVHGAGSPFLESARARLGTLMLARRWYARRNTPDGLLNMAELGAARIPSVDPDVDRLLKLGRYRGPVVA